jgi:hypothetical protein
MEDGDDLRTVEALAYAATPLIPGASARDSSIAEELNSPTALSAAILLRYLEQCPLWAAANTTPILWRERSSSAILPVQAPWPPGDLEALRKTLGNAGGYQAYSSAEDTYVEPFSLLLRRSKENRAQLESVEVRYANYLHTAYGPPLPDGRPRAYADTSLVFALTNQALELHMPERGSQLTLGSCALLVPRIWQTLLQLFQSPFELAWRPPREPLLVTPPQRYFNAPLEPAVLDSTPEFWVRAVPNTAPPAGYHGPMRLHYSRPGALSQGDGPDNSILRVPLKPGGAWHRTVHTLADIAQLTLPEYGAWDPALPQHVRGRGEKLREERSLAYVGAKRSTAKTLREQIEMLYSSE